MNPSIAVIGSGNVAYHMVKMYASHGYIQQILVRNKTKAQKIYQEFSIEIIDSYEKLKPVDIILITTSDDAIQGISKKIPFQNTLVVHTSGSVAIEAIAQKEKGVFYPLQTFSLCRKLNYQEIPFFIEGNSPQNEKILTHLAQKISTNVHLLTSEKRKHLHIAAIWVNNFTNANLWLAEEYLQENNLSFQIIIPLLKETVAKAIANSPSESQTGPAKRNDKTVINHHLKLLENQHEMKQLYKLFSHIIYKKTHEEL